MAWGAAIGAGLQVLSQVLPHILGGKKGGGQISYETIRNNAVRQAMALVEAGKQSGIHPLALLGSGITSGGFAQPVGGSGFGIGDAIGAGLSTIGEALYADDTDRREAAREERMEQARQREVAIANLRAKEITPERKLQLENMRLQNELLSTDIATSRTKLAAMRAGALGGTSGETLVGPGGTIFNPVPGRSTAQQAEDTYGEPGDWLFGAAGLLEDFIKGRVKVDPMMGGGPRINNPLTTLYDRYFVPWARNAFISTHDKRMLGKRPGGRIPQ